MKYIKSLLFISCLFSAPFVQASEIAHLHSETTHIDFEAGLPPTLRATYKELQATFIKDEEDIQKVVNLCSLSNPEGLPSNPENWARNYITRLEKGNPYACLLFREGENTAPIAAVGLGRMTVTGYDPKFTDILDTYLEFGVIRPKQDALEAVQDKMEKLEIANLPAQPSQSSGEQSIPTIAPISEVSQNLQKKKIDYAQLEQVNNFGIQMIVPVIPLSLSSEKKDDILRMTFDISKTFKEKGHLLPIEGHVPHDVIALLHPEDSLIQNFENVGFKLIKKEGFYGYYDKRRVMLHNVLQSIFKRIS